MAGCALLAHFLLLKKRPRNGGTCALIIAAVTLLGSAQAGQPADDVVAYELTLKSPSGAVLPEVRLLDRPIIAAEVNRDLNALASGLACPKRTKYTVPLAYRSRASVTYAANDVLSVSVHAAYNCGGAYPTNDANVSMTYDLESGERVPFELLFADYRRDEARIVRVLLPALRAAGMIFSEQCAGVLTAENLSSYGFAYSLSRAGLTVQPNFPHAIEACSQGATVPFRHLRAFARADGVLARVAHAERRHAP